jgi:hypothetical protein
MKFLLRELFQLYVQDFDVVYAKDTDPLDYFCQTHDEQDLNQLIDEMKALLIEVTKGVKGIRDIKDMGLEYLPAPNRSPEMWLPDLIEYLQEKASGVRR